MPKGWTPLLRRLKVQNIYYLVLLEKVSHLCCAYLPTRESNFTGRSSVKAWIQDTSLPSLGFPRKMFLNDVRIVYDDDNKTCDCLLLSCGAGAEERPQGQRRGLGAWVVTLGCPILCVYCGGSSNIIAFVY